MQLVKKSPAFMEPRKSLTVPTSVRRLSLSWANSIQSPWPPPTSWKSILILSSHLCLGLPSGLFPSGFPTNTRAHVYHSPYVPHALPISFVSILPPAQYWVRSTDHSAPHYAAFSIPLIKIACMHKLKKIYIQIIPATINCRIFCLPLFCLRI